MKKNILDLLGHFPGYCEDMIEHNGVLTRYPEDCPFIVTTDLR